MLQNTDKPYVIIQENIMVSCVAWWFALTVHDDEKSLVECKGNSHWDLDVSIQEIIDIILNLPVY